MEMDAFRECRVWMWKEGVNKGNDALFLDAYSDEQLNERIGQAQMRIEDEGLIMEACRQMLRQRGLAFE